MHPLQYTSTCEATQEWCWLWEEGLFIAHPQNRSWTQEVQPNPNWLVWMMLFLRFCGQGNFWMVKGMDTDSVIYQDNRVQCCWRNMARYQVVNENAKKMCNIILWRIELCCVLSGQEWTSKYDFRMRKVDFVSMHVKARNVWTRLRWCCSCAAEFVLGWQPSTHKQLEMFTLVFNSLSDAHCTLLNYFNSI